jgi:hypothetical protein
LETGEIIPIDHDYMIIHDDTELFAYQKALLDYRYGFAQRVGDASTVDAVKYVLQSYPHASLYLYQKWGKAYVSNPALVGLSLENQNDDHSEENSTASSNVNSVNPDAADKFTRQLTGIFKKAGELDAGLHYIAANKAFALHEKLETSFI